jgi:hypothetical protein
MTTPDLEQPAAEPEAPRPRRRWKRWLVIVPGCLLFLFALYTWAALHWDYSSGFQSGMLQKFSRKGWLCKTWEGEIWQTAGVNMTPTIWSFTVREGRIARQLDSLVGRPVRVHYTEHRGVPTSCFGDTNYYVDSVVVVQ